MHHSSLDYLLLHLSLIDGVGPATIMRINERIVPHHGEQLYAMSAHELATHASLSHTQAQSIVTGLADRSLLAHAEELLQKHVISWMTTASTGYPEILKHIYAPPSVLYWCGNLPQTEKTVAIVGSRTANAYGQRIIDRIMPELIRSGIMIISGGALGIDTMAHRKTVELQGLTTVVLGSGLLHWYPYANKKLFQAIIDAGGCIMSPFSPNTQPYPGNFPARNRIIAGLARVTIVMQASHKSGALITAQYALDQGREVMAVPGAIDDPLSQGCNTLLAQGATVVTDASPVLQALGISVLGPEESPQRAATMQPHTALAPSPAAPAGPEDTIIALCKEPRSIDELLHEGCSDNLDRLVQLLFDLQLTGKIQQDFTGRWQSVR